MTHVIAGFLAGLAIAVVTVLVEHSEIGFGPYSLSGNGAIAVPVILTPLALYGLWVWQVRSGRGWRPMLLATLGLWIGVGCWTALEIFYGLGISIPAIVLNGALFVLPTALLTGLVYWLFAAERVPPTPLSVALASIAGLGFALFLLPLFPLWTGLLAGPAVYTASKADTPSSLLPVTVALIGLLLIAGFALPLLVIR